MCNAHPPVLRINRPVLEGVQADMDARNEESVIQSLIWVSTHIVHPDFQSKGYKSHLT